MARIIVAIELVTGGRYQAACRTEDCTDGRNGRPWRGAAHVVKVAAEDDARWHRQRHRGQQTIPKVADAPTVADLIGQTGLSVEADVSTALPTLTWHVTGPLRQAGITNLGSLAAWTDDDLLELPQFGERRLKALKRALAERQTGDAA